MNNLGTIFGTTERLMCKKKKKLTPTFPCRANNIIKLTIGIS
jgi:hypothetical protein